MKGIRPFIFRLGSMFRRKRIERDLDDEIRIHLEMAAEANLASGLAPAEARRLALRQFGGVDQIKEAYRDERVLTSLDQWAADLRLAARSLARARGFSMAALLVIALCLAANVAIFSAVNGALLRPLPFPEAGRLVVVNDNYPKAGLYRTGASAPEYRERKAGISAFGQTGAFRTMWFILGEEGAPETGIEGAEATPSFFRTLGVGAALGRVFTEDEAVMGKEKVVVLGDAFWRGRLGADPAVVGKTLRFQGVAYTVVGVMPPDFHFLSHDAQIWKPLVFSADDLRNDHRHGNFVTMVARLRPGATRAEAQAQLEAVNEQSRTVDPMAENVRAVGYFSRVDGLQADHVAEQRPTLLLLEAGVLVLLLIGAVNLANLFLVRATSRMKEFSLRRALGAHQRQLVRFLVAESMLLSLTGGLIGIGLGVLLVRCAAAYAASRLPSDMVPRADFPVCLAGLGLSVVLGMALSAPAIAVATRCRLASALTVESRSGTTTRSVHRLRHTLVAVQIALCFVLMSGTGLLGFSLVQVMRVRTGFQPDNLMTAMVELPWWSWKLEAGRQKALRDEVLRNVRAIPGTTAAALANAVPFSGRSGVEAWSIVGGGGTPDEFIKEGLYTHYVTEGYFATLGIPLREGRLLTEDDVSQKRLVCLVDEEFARRHWPKGGAVGSRLVRPGAPSDGKVEYETIVGVVGSVKKVDLADRRDQASVYFPFPGWSAFMVAVRTVQSAEGAASALRAAVQAADPSLVLYDLKTMESRIDESLQSRRTPLMFASVFGGFSLLLAAVGIYGVLAYSVAQRRREIGVRMALGAQPAQILRQFLGLGLGLLGIGIPIGVAGTLAAGQALRSMLFDVSPQSPLVMGACAILLAGAALPACLLPSRRAARVAPAEALRSD
jgi:predicted permease